MKQRHIWFTHQAARITRPIRQLHTCRIRYKLLSICLSICLSRHPVVMSVCQSITSSVTVSQSTTKSMTQSVSYSISDCQSVNHSIRDLLSLSFFPFRQSIFVVILFQFLFLVFVLHRRHFFSIKYQFLFYFLARIPVRMFAYSFLLVASFSLQLDKYTHGVFN